MKIDKAFSKVRLLISQYPHGQYSEAILTLLEYAEKQQMNDKPQARDLNIELEIEILERSIKRLKAKVEENKTANAAGA